MSDLEYRALTPSDFDLVRDLYEVTKSRLRADDYDRWRFFGTPWGDSPAVIAVDGAICAGLYIVWPTMLELGGEPIPGAQSMDTMTHPDYRGRGLFVELAERTFALAADRGFEVVYGFPNSASYPGFIRRLNFDHVGDVPSWSYPLGRRGFMRTLGRGPSELQATDAEDVRPLIDEWVSERDVVRIRKDETWFDWRYGPSSHERYEWLATRSGDAAALVGERDETWGGHGEGFVRIHELVGRTPEALEALLRELGAKARADGKRALQILAWDERLQAPLTSAGFRRDAAYPLIVRKLVARRLPANVHHFPAWRVVGGDMDSF